MPGRHIDVTMDGAALPSGIIVQQVHEDPATMEILNGDRPGRDGQLVLGIRRTTRKVAIECLITEIHNLQTRAQKADALAQWARGTALAVNYRPTQVLHGHCTSYPSLTDVRDYTAPLRVEFTADVVPYWEDKTEITRSISNAKISSISTSSPVRDGQAREPDPDGVFRDGGGADHLPDGHQREHAADPVYRQGRARQPPYPAQQHQLHEQAHSGERGRPADHAGGCVDLHHRGSERQCDIHL